ncbi:hypothetical protein [Lysinibacillus parviboronicapiens]|uniref:hypothetical protein n=1 Tax=Lysinibacillus parviboronicapiens TaxID=436516 RepID=UPI0006D1B004|nr:hypothetical protein [Lysinibacillus parviboronicapiens]
MTKFIEQRVNELENEVAELKLIVHQIRESKVIDGVSYADEPCTTNTVEDIIEFEGKKYRKVKRKACEGDIIMYSEIGNDWMHITPNKPYKAYKEDGPIRLLFTRDSGGPCRVYGDDLILNGLESKNIKVYELIVEDKPLTPNQQRAAIIEKAKNFVEDCKDKLFVSRDLDSGKLTEHKNIYKVSELNSKADFTICDCEFITNVAKRTIVALLKAKKSRRIVARCIAKCNTSDVYNEHIGKAIALGRALGLDISEFEQAVQPTELVVGQIIYFTNEHGSSIHYRIDEINKNKDSVLTIVKADGSENLVGEDAFADFEDGNENIKEVIINDTNAIYGGVE